MSSINDTGIIDLVVETDQPANATPKHTWRDLPSWRTHGDDFTSEDVDRVALENHHVAHFRYAAAQPNIGALMLWNETEDGEGGHLAMFTAQSADEERHTVENASAMVNKGLVYSERRTGRHWLAADCHIEDGGHVFAVYFVPNVATGKLTASEQGKAVWWTR